MKNDRCSDRGKKYGAKSLCLSLKAIHQKVFCANNTARNSVCGVNVVCYATVGSGVNGIKCNKKG